jgi:hypothetical protein
VNIAAAIIPDPTVIADAKPTSPWWNSTAALLAFMVMSTIPLWFVSTPPLIDFLGHMSRYHVALEIGNNPILARDWSYEWAVIANLGVDLLIMPLAALVGLETAGWIVAASLPPLMIWGIFRAARALYGEVPPSAIAALPFALAYPYQYGFVNFWLASALAFHAFAFWVALESRPRLRALLFVPAGLTIWLCHAYGWAVLGVLVGGYELSKPRAPGIAQFFRAGIAAVLRTWPLLVTLGAMAFWRSGAEGAETLRWFDFSWKLHAAILTLRDQSRLLDLGTLAAAIFLIYFAWRDPRARLDPRFGIAALLFTAALILLPFQLFGSAFADARVYPFLFIAALLAVRLRPGQGSERTAQLIAGGFAALFAVRIAVSAIGYVDYDAAYQRHLSALDHVERGASVAVMVAHPCDTPWRLSRVDHLGSMALLRRDAFVNSQWDVPGAELLRPKHALGTGFNADPSQFVRHRDCPKDLRPELAAKIGRLPSGYFNYIWVLNFGAEPLPAYPNWTPVYSDDNSTLLRLAR